MHDIGCIQAPHTRIHSYTRMYAPSACMFENWSLWFDFCTSPAEYSPWSSCMQQLHIRSMCTYIHTYMQILRERMSEKSILCSKCTRSVICTCVSEGVGADVGACQPNSHECQCVYLHRCKSARRIRVACVYLHRYRTVYSKAVVQSLSVFWVMQECATSGS